MPNDKTLLESAPAIGKLALKNNLISRDDLLKALKGCGSPPVPERTLVEQLLKHDLISRQDLKRVLNLLKTLQMRKKEIRFGAIAMEKGYLTKSVLQLALEEQKSDLMNKRKPRRIGDILVETGFFTLAQRDEILESQNRLKKDDAVAPDPIPDQAQGKDQDDQDWDLPTAVPQENRAKPDADEAPTEKEQPAAEPEKPAMMEPVILDGGVILQISSDFYAAFLTKTKDFESSLTVEDLKNSLTEHDIIYGVAVDELIQGFLKSKGFKTKAFRVAKGDAPVEGKDARVEFFFNTDHLKAGGIDKEGNIDFKDRGEIPLVQEGTVLAEKTPPVKAKNGTNIYGEEIMAAPERDIALKYSKGTKLSEDGLKILATVTGYPKFTLSEVVFVHEEYEVDGDVDYETGHVEYPGNVIIKGCIKSGFKVDANDVTAHELDGGIVNAEGDLIINGGINESTVYAKGNVTAKFIHKSTILCMGNIMVEKEIVDSTLESYGALRAFSGKVISSQVNSKMGIFVRNVGSETSSPCIFRIGQDPFMEKELKKNQEQKDQIQKEIDKIKEKQAGLEEEHRKVQQAITEYAHIQDRAQLNQREVSDRLSTIEADPEKADDAKTLKEAMKKLTADAHEAEVKLDESFDVSEKLETSIDQLNRKVDIEQQKIDDLGVERKNLIKLMKSSPANPVVEVINAMMPGTAVIGKHSEKRLTEMIRNANIREMPVKMEDGSDMGMYEIRVMNR